jgi:RNA polymerase sigma-70 factor (ECF subfamily)
MGLREDRAMARYANGEDAAFEEVYAAVAPRVTKYLRARVRDRRAVDDLVVRTFVVMHEGRASFFVGAEVTPWALAIAERLAEAYEASARRTSWWRDVTRNLRRRDAT